VRMTTKLITPAQGLVEYNASRTKLSKAPIKFDRWRTIATDPFYASILDIDKQIKVRNENGLHESLITKEQHFELVKIFDGKKKNQSGPRKNGNPKYPANNIAVCDGCLDIRNGRFVGFDHTNGKNPNRVYESYRCRACGKYMSREKMHAGILKEFDDNCISKEGFDDLMEALSIVWKRQEKDMKQEIIRTKSKIEALSKVVSQQVEAATDPTNELIKKDIFTAITKKKEQITEMEEHLEELVNNADDDKEQFLKFAFNFLNNAGEKFLDESLSQEHRLRCKQVMFPAGFYVDENKKVYTPEKSLLITLAATKKDAKAPNLTHMVRVRGL
jgi:hypothetical protein